MKLTVTMKIERADGEHVGRAMYDGMPDDPNPLEAAHTTAQIMHDLSGGIMFLMLHIKGDTPPEGASSTSGRSAPPKTGGSTERPPRHPRQSAAASPRPRIARRPQPDVPHLMPGRPITELCTEPRTTRNAARAGLPTPCHRCLAYRPTEPLGCALINATRASPPSTTTYAQSTIWPKEKST